METLAITIVFGIPVLLGILGAFATIDFLLSGKAGQGGEPSEAGPAVSTCEPASVPRRFGVDGPLIFLTLYAMLFSILRAYDLEPMWFVLAALYLTGIIFGQMLLYGNKDPRRASMVGGAIGFSVAAIAGTVWIGVQHGISLGSLVERSLCFLVGVLGIGNLIMVPVSYLMGSLIAGAFLILDRVRIGQWNPSHEPDAAKKNQDPWEELRDLGEDLQDPEKEQAE